MKRLSLSLAAALSCYAAFAEEEKQGQDVTGAAWDHFNNGRNDAALALVEKSLPEFETQAKEQAAAMRGFDAKGQEWDHGAVNIAGTLWLIRGRIFEKQERTEEALAAYRTAVSEYPFAQAWDPGGWFWHPGEDAKKRAYKCLLRTAIEARTLDGKFFPVQEDALDLPAQRNAVRELAGELLAKNDFAAVEHFAERARTERIQMSNGEWVLHFLYLGIDSPIPVSKKDEEWETWHERLRQWRESVPKSVTARVAEAHFLIRNAWRARGSGYANTVKPEAWEVFGRRLAEARDVLKNTPRECPEWYQARLIIGMAQSNEPTVYDRLFNEGWKAFPGYTPLVEVRTYNLLPRWHGTPGDWQRAAAAFARRNGPQYYSVAVRYAAVFEKEKEAFRDIDRDLFRESWEARIKDRPGSVWLLHQYARALARMNDPLAAEWLDKLGDSFQAETWVSSAEIDAARQRSGATPGERPASPVTPEAGGELELAAP